MNTKDQIVNTLWKAGLESHHAHWLTDVILDYVATDIEFCRKALADRGYFTKNLWHIDDVKSKFDCTDEQAKTVLQETMLNDAVFTTIWDVIEIIGNDRKLKKHDDTDSADNPE